MNQFPNGVVSFASEKSLNQLSLKQREDVCSHELPIVENSLNTLTSYNRELRTAEMQRQTQTQTSAQNRATQVLKGEMVSFMFHLSKLELNEKTIYCRVRNLELLFRNGADLRSPESVKMILATKKVWSKGFKKNLLQAFKTYAKWKKIDLSNVELPKYKVGARLPYVPKQSLLDQLIAGAGWKTGAFLRLLLETGARTIEAACLQWSDIDAENRSIAIRNPAKNGLPRQIHVSEKCIEMLMRQPRNGEEYVFGKDPDRIRKRMRANFHWARGHIAAKTANKDLLKIHLHTFRHFFATKLYLQTRDIRYVQKKMGHRSITSTTIYENSEPNQEVETYTVKAVTTREEAEKLMALGYEFHYRTQDGVDLFRKKVIGLD